MAKIAFVTATYDKPELLAECGRSVLAQQHTDWTWIIALNSPSVETRSVAQRLCAKDRRIRVEEFSVTEEERDTIYQPCKIANALFDAVDSEYLSWVSDDDLLAEKFIDKLCIGLDAVYCSVARYVQHGLRWDFNCINWAIEPWQYGISDGGSMVIKKSVWDSLGWRFPLDWATGRYADQLFMQAVNNKHQLKAVPDVLLYKRQAWNSAHQKGVR